MSETVVIVTPEPEPEQIPAEAVGIAIGQVEARVEALPAQLEAAVENTLESRMESFQISLVSLQAQMTELLGRAAQPATVVVVDSEPDPEPVSETSSASVEQVEVPDELKNEPQPVATEKKRKTAFERFLLGG